MKSHVIKSQSETQADLPEDFKKAYVQQLNHQWAIGYTDGGNMAFATIVNMITQMKDKNTAEELLNKIERFCNKSLSTNRNQTIALYENIRKNNFKKEGN